MNDKKKTIVALWIATTVLLILFFFLPQKADRYFLSARVLNHEKSAVQAQAEGQKNTFPFFRNDKDSARVLKMLELRAQDDGKWLAVHLGLIVFVLNTLACFLYIFNMRPVVIAAWAGGYLFIAGMFVLQSYFSIRP